VVDAVADAGCVEERRRAAGAVHVADAVADYAVRLVRATREPASVAASLQVPVKRPVQGLVAVGASPRASLFLLRAARARALLEGRDWATPHDVKRAAPDVLRHRVLLTYEAEADGVAPEAVVEAVLAAVETP
jgi:MoxR-like ATPase